MRAQLELADVRGVPYPGSLAAGGDWEQRGVLAPLSWSRAAESRRALRHKALVPGGRARKRFTARRVASAVKLSRGAVPKSFSADDQRRLRLEAFHSESCRFRKKKPSLEGWVFSCGSEGIRTPGRLPYAGFQNRCLRPLGHASAAVSG